MFDWENLRVFIAVAETGGLSAAARRLQVDHATVSRRLAALEAELSVRLVERLPRACRLTAAGEQVLVQATRMQDGAFGVARAARAEQASMQGKVTLSVPPVLAAPFYAAHLGALRQRHPGLTLSMPSQAQSVSLGRREADIAVRLFRPAEPDNVTRRLGRMPFALYASHDYPAAARPEDWGFIAYDAQYDDMPHQRWVLGVAGTRPVVCEISDIATQQVVARSGLGVAGLPTFLGDADPTLQRLPWQGEPFERELWRVVHADLRHSPLIRAVSEFLDEVTAPVFGG
ncbi:MAG: HTH-type transcriptional activator AllS [Pseudomonas citronellolis]|nr:MAG: HTH-type transcriptional activator AllS [Pseudomonas citronellolis]